ncbi:MAG: DNA polymerase III subunit beta [Actinomycetes bacterium]
MKIRVERDVLAEAVAWAARSLPHRPPMPALAGLLLVGEPGRVEISAFDFEVSGRVEVAADVVDPGRVLVSGRLLADITRSLPAKPVDLGVEGTKVTLSCGSARFVLATLPLDEYPTLPVMPTSSGSVAGEVFAAAVGQVVVAAGRDDTLPVMTAVRLEFTEDLLTMAATDRYRLAVRELSWNPEQAGLEAAALVPARTLAEVAKSLATTEKVTVALSLGTAGDGIIGFEGAGRRTTTRLLDGEFPKYRSLLPTEASSVARVDTQVLVEAVRRVALVAERNTPARLTFTDGEVRIEARSGDDAAGTESVPGSLEGDDIEIAFNPGYLVDGLTALASPVSRLAFTASGKPALISAAGADDHGSTIGDGQYQYLLMPVRVSV